MTFTCHIQSSNVISEVQTIHVVLTRAVAVPPVAIIVAALVHAIVTGSQGSCMTALLTTMQVQPATTEAVQLFQPLNYFHLAIPFRIIFAIIWCKTQLIHDFEIKFKLWFNANAANAELLSITATVCKIHLSTQNPFRLGFEAPICLLSHVLLNLPTIFEPGTRAPCKSRLSSLIFCFRGKAPHVRSMTHA